jgi:hypothetical protein
MSIDSGNSPYTGTVNFLQSIYYALRPWLREYFQDWVTQPHCGQKGVSAIDDEWVVIVIRVGATGYDPPTRSGIGVGLHRS